MSGGAVNEPPRDLRAEVLLPLLQDVLAQGGRFSLPLAGSSMQPTLPEACEIEVVPLAGAPRLGQLMVFAVDDALVAHRLVRRRGDFLIAQGDNRLGPDRPLRPGQVLGGVAAARVEGRQIWPRRGEMVWTVVWLTRYHVLRLARWVRRRGTTNGR